MPQAYSVATGPAAASTRSPEAVSYTRGAGPFPGSTGTSTRRQESMPVRLSCGSRGSGGGAGEQVEPADGAILRRGPGRAGGGPPGGPGGAEPHRREGRVVPLG